MTVVAIIPARGGSKGIPGKNLRVVAGKPLIVHTIEHALATPSIGRVIVSTDDDEIAAVSVGHGAYVVRRPDGLSGDHASSEAALEHALDVLGSIRGVFYDQPSSTFDPEYVVFLQATSPIRDPDDIENAIACVRVDHADSLFSASPIHGFVWRDYALGPAPTYDPLRRPMRQDIAPDLVENGSIYVFKPDVLRQLGCRFGRQIAVYRQSVECGFQVDEPEDLELVEAVMEMRAKRARREKAA